MMERFKLVYLGERLEPYAHLSLDKHFSLLPFGAATIEKLTSGKPVTMKSNLELDGAMKIKAKLTKLGLSTQLRLQLTSECLAQGLLLDDVGVSMLPQSFASRERRSKAGSNSDTQSNLSAKKLSETRSTDQRVMVLAPMLKKPLIARKPSKLSISNHMSVQSLSVESSSFKFGDLWLIALCVYFGINLQSYVTWVFIYYGPSNMLASILSVVFLIAITFCFPKIIQPLDCVSIVDQKTQSLIELVESQNFFLGVAKWRLFDYALEPIGELIVSTNKAQLECNTGKEYYWSSTSKLNDTSEDALSNIQDAILEETQLGIFLTALGYLTKIGSYFVKPNADQKVIWGDLSATVITDEAGAPVALIYDHPSLAYKIIRDQSEDDLVLSAFCITIIRTSLV
jgi:hypothetical protein